MKLARPIDIDIEVASPRIILEMADVGQMVRLKRRQQQLRIDDAAALTDVSVDLFSRLENGKGAVRLDKLLQVLDAMGLCMVVASKQSELVRDISKVQVITSESSPLREQEG
ncbi:helix-turn-helix domain-containing protein [Undibacterium sp. Di24W]|uniref:helix-turn-helix domain-containing protein n=1 Tax=Undibacterium sp. Di24W TaxID=3413033 RepID=UPI003BF27E08